MSEDRLVDIQDKLNMIIKLLASNIIEGKSQTEAILALGNIGINRNTIADIVGTSPLTVSVRLSEAKKKTNSTKRGKRK